MHKEINVAISKTDAQQQTATGLIFQPLVIDAQGDFMTAAEIQAASQRFMKSGRTRNIDVNHSGVAVDAFVAESMIAKDGDDFPVGSWVTTIKIEDPQIWKAVRDKKLRGLSLLGNGDRTVTKLHGKEARQITGLDVQAISLVEKAANQEEFSVIKSDNDPMQQLAAQLTAIAEGIQKTTETIQQGLAAQQAQLDRLSKGADGRVVRKAEPVNQNAGRIESTLRKRARLQERLESIFERPDLFPENAEAELRAGIQKADDKLYALGHADARAGIDSNSAFFQRGGTSNFLQGGVSSLDAILGVSPATQALRKSEDEIEVENCLVL